MGTRASERRAHCFGLVAARIVHDDDVATAERWDQLGFDIDPEGVATDRVVENPRGVDPVMAQVSSMKTNSWRRFTFGRSRSSATGVFFLKL